MARHGTLHMVAHNLADSLSGGLSFVLGMREVHLWADARRDPQGIVIDLLTGAADGPASDDTQRVARAAASAFPGFCRRHGVRVSDYALCHVRFVAPGKRIEVTVEDARGRRSVRHYAGWPGRVVRLLDFTGRVRRTPEPRHGPAR